MNIDSILEKLRKNECLNREKTKKIIFVTAFILIFLRILSYAWCSDDAFHIYTMAKNLLAGNGFTPTPGLRVNVATCPLWALVITFGMLFWNNPYAIGMIFNLLFSGIALFLLFRLIYKKENWFAILVCVTAILCFSKTYLSYTTSGLENALILLLSTLYLEVFFQNEYFSKKELFKIALLEGLIAFTRMDCALIFSLTSVYAFLFRYKKDKSDSAGFSWKKLFTLIPIALTGLSPFIFWELFSLFYYGSFVPNTALAKLNTGLPLNDYLVRGVWYTVKTGTWDIFVLFVPFCFVLYVVGKHYKIDKFFLTASGIALYFFYIIYIGGDFMLGRHFLSLFWVAFIVCEIGNDKTFFIKSFFMALLILLFQIGFSVETREMLVSYGMPYPKLIRTIQDKYTSKLATSDYCWDERKVYYRHTGLLTMICDYLKNGKITIIYKTPHRGIQWFYGNKQLYEYILYDPLLSRLPAIHSPDWVIGHMKRKIPAGYQETLDSGENHIKDANLAFYYSKLKFMISGDLFDRDRIKEIFRFNSGKYNTYLKKYIEIQDLVTE